MTEREYMQLALQLAKSATGQTSPNPLVGSVVVKDGEIVGLGAHLKAGEAHAEVHALTMAGEKAKGATVYVTLEPCSHYGKTPPCANLLIEKQVKKVVIASVDPNPKVAGQGIRKLEAAGIEVEVGLLEEEAKQVNTVFFHNLLHKRPFVTMKSATSLDGKTATVTGESKWITGSTAREDVHRYRHEHDAILVGIGTVLADDPSLTTRLQGGGNNPIRVILDSSLRIPMEAKVIQDKEAPTWIMTLNQANQEKKIELLQAGVAVFEFDTLDINPVLALLYEQGITSLFVEGGARVNGSFLLANAVDQIITYIAPKLIGGDLAPTAIGGKGFARMEETIDLHIQSVEQIGEDIKIISRKKGGH
ncbi:bifunctional diaminohydroxyphosphoribosylaminopyrimidine deaminase/5-amino-6-(5-phosphoribosylamino)uracil reductase RibD [Alkalihalobacterium bogoriense]|uniref:bifunctional diaminohydroxyphosphoribosylaminopyrimidine deaminase/5-amino-6-(5-phosphoribosylamino)uracil reductase RibD n=1 Tax=Alkalihalobacterium bogoriense TaxID=246272 RepID=UPI00047BB363|nr:bifunctional diaminohydroxyphosphoribosylaminopyrimidine deaminase/5-amino-6-(5-phosphoribosylamino)uracil reductase RibD [Alkalihalobacterium bogoriense]